MGPEITDSADHQRRRPQLILGPPGHRIRRVEIMDLVNDYRDTHLVHNTFDSTIQVPLTNTIEADSQTRHRHTSNKVSIMSIEDLNFSRHMHTPVRTFRLRLTNDEISIMQLTFHDTYQHKADNLHHDLIFNERTINSHGRLLVDEDSINMLNLILVIPTRILDLHRLPLQTKGLLTVIKVQKGLIPQGHTNIANIQGLITNGHDITDVNGQGLHGAIRNHGHRHVQATDNVAVQYSRFNGHVHSVNGVDRLRVAEHDIRVTLARDIATEMGNNHTTTEAHGDHLTKALPIDKRTDLRPNSQSDNLTNEKLAFALVKIKFSVRTFTIVPRHRIVTIDIPAIKAMPIANLSIHKITRRRAVSLVHIDLQSMDSRMVAVANIFRLSYQPMVNNLLMIRMMITPLTISNKLLRVRTCHQVVLRHSSGKDNHSKEDLYHSNNHTDPRALGHDYIIKAHHSANGANITTMPHSNIEAQHQHYDRHGNLARTGR